MEPVLHLSIVVADLEGARSFYVDTLGCRPGREHEDWMDVWFFGLQLTLQERPDQVLASEARSKRHFGVTLDPAGFADVLARLRSSPGIDWVVPVSTDDPGTPLEQTKAKLADPSGNVIEFKTYADPEAAFARCIPPGASRERRARGRQVAVSQGGGPIPTRGRGEATAPNRSAEEAQSR